MQLPTSSSFTVPIILTTFVNYNLTRPYVHYTILCDGESRLGWLSNPIAITK